MQHIYGIEESHLNKIEKLFDDKLDGEYFCISEGPVFSEICQWSDKYQNVKILTVPTEKLDYRKRLV